MWSLWTSAVLNTCAWEQQSKTNPSNIQIKIKSKKLTVVDGWFQAWLIDEGISGITADL